MDLRIFMYAAWLAQDGCTITCHITESGGGYMTTLDVGTKRMSALSHTSLSAATYSQDSVIATVSSPDELMEL